MFYNFDCSQSFMLATLVNLPNPPLRTVAI